MRSIYLNKLEKQHKIIPKEIKIRAESNKNMKFILRKRLLFSEKSLVKLDKKKKYQEGKEDITISFLIFSRYTMNNSKPENLQHRRANF